MKFEVASQSDIPKLCGLLDSLFTQETEFKPDNKTQILGLELIINNSEIGNILVARKNNELIGMVNLLYTISTALGARVAFLEDMVVSSSERGSGTGSKLLEFALDYAQEQGCERITLLTDSENTGAHHFYKKHGFSRSSMVAFRRSINNKNA
ncbi:MAG: GNAT family N-acetyltransferase [Cellvibrionales bacterium]|nr:MAG: GNAT family N-acetyltransferase [Cellvibrionales bacterium]